MWSVPPGLRPFAMSMSVVTIHILGDVPSPPLLGALQGALGNWRLSMSLLCLLLLAGAAVFAAGTAAARTAPDYRQLTLEPVENSFRGVDGRGRDGGSSSSNGDVGAGWGPGEEPPPGRCSPERPLLLRGVYGSSPELPAPPA